jgi:hypothetical protein
MIRCVMVFARNGKYHRIPDAEVEDWEEVLDGVDGAPVLIERIDGWAPYTRAYRMPDRSVYLVAIAGD